MSRLYALAWNPQSQSCCGAKLVLTVTHKCYVQEKNFFFDLEPINGVTGHRERHDKHMCIFLNFSVCFSDSFAHILYITIYRKFNFWRSGARYNNFSVLLPFARPIS